MGEKELNETMLSASKEAQEREARERDAHEKAEVFSKRMEDTTSNAAESILDWLEGEGADKPREEKLKAISARIDATCMMALMTMALM